MSSSLTLQENPKRNLYINGINSIVNYLSQGFEKLLDEAIKNENSQLPRKLDPKAINELIKLFTEIIFLLSPPSSISIFDVNFRLHKGELGVFSRLVPQEELLKEIESVVNRNAKKRKQYFYGPFEKVHNLLKDINQNIKPPVAYYIYGVAEKMIYLILKNSVFYEESTKLNDPIISQTTIQNVVKLLEFRKTADAQSQRPAFIPSNYDKCAEQLRNFLQSCYDQCNIILRVYFDPVKAKLPDSIKQIHRLVSSFMNIFRAMLESIEDMNDHVSSGGSGRNVEQGLIGYCLEGPAEDYLLYDFTTYTTSVNNNQFKSDLLSVIKDEEAVKALMNRGRSIMQTIITKYDCGKGYCWPWLHKGCVYCSVVTTGSKINEAFVVNELIPGSNHTSDAADSLTTEIKCYTKCNYLVNCYIYLLPRLLFVPIFHFLYLQELIEQLSRLSYNEEDQISLKEVVSFFHGRRKDIIDILKTVPSLEVIYNRLSLLHLKDFQPVVEELKCFTKNVSMKLEEINNINGNRSQELTPYNNSEFIMSGNLLVQSDNKRCVRRTVYLFNNVLLIYKLQETSWKPPLTQQNSPFKLKKIIPLDCIHIIDGDNVNPVNSGQSIEIHLDSFGSSTIYGDDPFIGTENKSKTNTYYSFRLQFQDQKPSNGSLTIQTMNFATNVIEEKCDWMACLLQIQTNKLFEKYIKELPKQEIPLRLPHPKKYKFSEPDSNENIRFEKTENDGFLEISDEEDNNEDMTFTEMSFHSSIKKPFGYGHPQVRYATLHKLIERLTYHTYHDLRALHMFLLAYRRFTTPQNLLDLLIERFSIPEPDFTMEERTPEWKDEKSQADQMLKRFKNSYQRRVQRRVIWVLLRWVQNPGFFRYDFANNPEQREKLVNFVNSIKTKELQKACQILRSKCSNEDLTYCNFGDSYLLSDRDCPPILLWELVKHPCEIRITNVHPVELARQITLHEWDLYHKIEYWEVEGKENTSENTPNLSKSKDFSNKLRNWLVHSILSEEHPEDRAVALMRVADIMILCEHWNNLQGSQEARAALISASVFRLKKSFSLIIRKYKTYKQIFNNLRKEHENGKGHKPSLYTQEYENNIQKIEEADPPVPCVPFIAFGVTTKLIHTELKSPDTISTESGNILINFRKHRRLSQIIERYLSFQRLPYQFQKEPLISAFLCSLDPLRSVAAKNDDDFERIMFEISEKYEPRDLDSHNTFELALSKERKLTKQEQKHADDIANLSTKERLEISNKSPANGSYSTLTSTSRSVSTLSSLTLTSEPSTPTNSQSPTFQSQQRLSEGLSDISLDSPSEIPPLPPRSTNMTRNEFNFNSPGIIESFSLSPQNVISPKLPPRLPRGNVPPPLPTRHSKD